MSRITTLEIEGRAPIDSPSWETVETALNSIRPSGPGFFTLSRSDGSYVQTAGAKLRLIVEYRMAVPNGFRHFVLGQPQDGPTDKSINTTAGVIRLKSNEILSLRDALRVFGAFWSTGAVPGSYSLRDVTSMFADPG